MEHYGFVVDGDGFTPLPLELNEPIPIARRDLVILDESKEEMEAVAAARPKRGNKAEQRANALLIGALAQAAYPDDLAHPYRIANKACGVIELMGAKLSRETAAKKIRDALELKVS